MFALILGILIGIIIGWNWSQPPLAVELQRQVVDKIRAFLYNIPQR